MVKNIELEQLVINKLTQEQFDSIEEKNPAELYFITDAEADGGTGAQVEEMPEATEMNAGQIVQYVGETNDTYTSGFFYKCTETDGVYSWTQVNVQGGGDYLPLSGGELTGTLNIKPEVSDTYGDVLTLSYGTDDVVIQKNRYARILNLGKTTLTLEHLTPVLGSETGIGSPNSPFKNIYAARISGSTSYSDTHYLTVPNKDGTIATVEDIDAAVGDISTALTSILGE